MNKNEERVVISLLAEQLENRKKKSEVFNKTELLTAQKKLAKVKRTLAKYRKLDLGSPFVEDSQKKEYTKVKFIEIDLINEVKKIRQAVKNTIEIQFNNTSVNVSVSTLEKKSNKIKYILGLYEKKTITQINRLLNASKYTTIDGLVKLTEKFGLDILNKIETKTPYKLDDYFDYKYKQGYYDDDDDDGDGDGDGDGGKKRSYLVIAQRTASNGISIIIPF